MNCHPWGPILAQGRQDSSPNPRPLTISRGQSAVGCVVLKYTCWISISPVRRSRKPQYLMQMTTMPPTLLLGKRLKTQEWAKKICQVWATWEVLAECQRKREGQRSPHRWVRSHCYRWTRKERNSKRGNGLRKAKKVLNMWSGEDLRVGPEAGLTAGHPWDLNRPLWAPSGLGFFKLTLCLQQF